MSSISNDFGELIKSNFLLNSTTIKTNASSVFMGSSTESALLKFALNHLGTGKTIEERINRGTVEMIPFDATRI